MSVPVPIPVLDTPRLRLRELRESDFPAYAAMMSGRLIAVHGLKNWIGVQAGRFLPRSVPRGLAANLNRPA